MILLGHTSNENLLPIEADEEQYDITNELKKLKMVEYLKERVF